MSKKRNLALCSFVLIWLLIGAHQSKANDSLKLAQSYINLSLTTAYFNSMPSERVARILPFVQDQLDSIQDQVFLGQNAALVHFAFAHLHYLKTKQAYQSRGDINREVLLGWKDDLDSALNRLYGLRRHTEIHRWKYDAYFEMIGVTEENYDKLDIESSRLKSSLNTHFNQDIYPDVVRIFYRAKDAGVYHFDSLAHFAALYDMRLDFSVLRNSDYPVENLVEWNRGRGTYRIAFAIDLIIRYLQLSYIADEGVAVQSIDQLYQDLEYVHTEVDAMDRGGEWSISYAYPDDIPIDDFVKNEMSLSAVRELGEKIRAKFPREERDYTEETSNWNVEGVPGSNGDEKKFYFPKVAPFPSAKMSIQNFLPDSASMGQVDRYIRKSFEAAGYDGRLHYLYLHEPGFAVTTDIERIEKDGSPKAPEQSRWDLTAAGAGDFSLYRIFKAIFFATESDFRMIACVVSAKEAVSGTSPASFSAISSIVDNSYSSLPADLADKVMTQKTLTILVYHFYQSDIGQVPLLDISKRLTVRHHLENTRSLKSITGNQP